MGVDGRGEYHCESFDESGHRFGGFVVSGETMSTALLAAARNVEVQLRPDMPELRITQLDVQRARLQQAGPQILMVDVYGDGEVLRLYEHTPQAVAALERWAQLDEAFASDDGPLDQDPATRNPEWRPLEEYMQFAGIRRIEFEHASPDGRAIGGRA